VIDANEKPEPIEAAPEAPLDETVPPIEEHQSEDIGPGNIGETE
jgi:hypothetical protein